MKSFTKINCAVFTVALAVLGCAQAGPQVSITFKNNGSSDAIYDFVGSSAYSYAEATPKPSKTINPGASDQFVVKGRLSADVTTAIFQYRTGMKTCKFKTSYLKVPGRGGTAPKWNKSSESGGGARCDVRVLSTDMRTHDWAVEFTMR